MRQQRIADIALALAGAALLIGAVLTARGTVNWDGVALWTRRWGVTAGLTVVGVACVASGLNAVRTPTARVPLRPVRWWVILAVITTATWGAVAWLLNTAPPEARLDAIRNGLGLGAGAAVVTAVLLYARRQWSNERAQAHVEDDATERRATELYTRAADQLGAGNDPVVRMAALYALEHLAQANPAHRQAVVNIVCGYLRMPFTPPPSSPTPNRLRHRAGAAPATLTVRRQELEVRLTAQRLLANHLYSDTANPAFWPGMNLDLTGAALVEFDLSGCRVADARFTGARFRGEAGFTAAQFGVVLFDDTDFQGDARFAQSRFGSLTDFTGARFHGRADFSGGQFEEHPDFSHAVALKGTRNVWPDGWTSRGTGDWLLLVPGPDWSRQRFD